MILLVVGFLVNDCSIVGWLLCIVFVLWVIIVRLVFINVVRLVLLIINKFEQVIFGLFLCGILLLLVMLMMKICVFISFEEKVVVRLLLLDLIRIRFNVLWVVINLLIVFRLVVMLLWIVVCGQLLVCMVVIWLFGSIVCVCKKLVFLVVQMLLVSIVSDSFFCNCWYSVVISVVLLELIGLLMLMCSGLFGLWICFG